MNLKRLAAAAALVCAAPAMAGINTLNDDAELFGIVWDENVATYALDFGVTLGQLAASTGSFALGSVGGANWASYVAADTNMADFQPFEGTRWAVVAVDDDGFNFIDGDLRFVSTTAGGLQPDILNQSLEPMLNGFGSIGQIGYFNQNGMTPDMSVNTDLFATVGSPAHVVDGNISPSFRVGNAIGGSTTLFGCTYSNFGDGTSPSTCAAMTNGLGQAVSVSFDGQSFAVTAVPEPGTYALLAAGLLAVGFMVRRRS